MTIYYDENQQQTRVLRTDTDTAPTAEERIGYTQPIVQEKKGLLDGLSLAQVTAGAAAAATSLFLSSTIGIAGSVIGAAVSSVVTVVCSQLYRRALDTGAEKIKGTIHGRNQRNAGPATTASTSTTTVPRSEDPLQTGPAATTATETRVAPDNLRERANERTGNRRASTQRRVALFSVLIAIAAVALCAGAIIWGTHGEGLGEKTEIISLELTSSDEQDASDEDEADAQAADTSSEETNGSATNESATEDASSAENSANAASKETSDEAQDSTSAESTDAQDTEQETTSDSTDATTDADTAA